MAQDKVRQQIFATINEDYFGYPAAQESYARFMSHLKAQSDPPSWRELINDVKISQETRRILSGYKKKVPTNRDSILRLINILNDYRQARILFYASENIINQLKKPKINLDDLISSTTDAVTKARTSTSRENDFLTLGDKKGDDKKILSKILNSSGESYIPTGFKQFDDVNIGLVRGGLMILAANSGGGKSIMAQNIALNMSRWGANVCYIPLEMDEEEMMMRRLSCLSDISMSKFLSAKEKMTEDEKARVRKYYKRYLRDCKNSGGSETYYVPSEDLELEEVLYILKPYGFDVIIVDYINLLKGMSDKDQWRLMGNASRFGKIYAKSNNCAMVLCAQLSDENKVKYSRALVENADLVWTWVYDENAKQNHIIPVNQLKARNQKAFTFPLVEKFECMRLRDPDQSEIRAHENNSKKQSKNSSNGYKKEKSRWNRKPDDIEIEEIADD